MRVLIVGAGPTGLTAAVELARRGLVPDVIDKKEEASTLSRAVGITPRSLEILEPSGVTARLMDEAIRIRAVHIYRVTRPVLTLSLVEAQARGEFFLSLAQDRTEAALHDALVGYGGSVRYNTELTGLALEGDQVIVTTADGATSAYDHVLGADGIHSVVRQSLGQSIMSSPVYS